MAYEELRASLNSVAFTTATPFTATGESVDHDALGENLEYLYEAGARLFIPCGNTGEYHGLDDEERIRVVQTHVDVLGSNATVIGGLGGSAPEAIRLARAYEDVGADGIMVMHPNHSYTHERGLITYYEELAKATDLGVVLYKQGPEVTRRVIHAVTTREDVIGVKYAAEGIQEFAAMIAGGPDDVAWINGIAERYALPYSIEGAVGYTTGIGNFFPRLTLEMFHSIEAEKYERARQIRTLLWPYEDLRGEAGTENVTPAANNVPAVKFGMDLAGLNGGPVRPPLADLSDADKTRARDIFDTIKNSDLIRV